MWTSSTMMDYLDFLAVQICAKRMSMQLTHSEMFGTAYSDERVDLTVTRFYRLVDKYDVLSKQESNCKKTEVGGPTQCKSLCTASRISIPGGWKGGCGGSGLNDHWGNSKSPGRHEDCGGWWQSLKQPPNLKRRECPCHGLFIRYRWIQRW